MACLLNEFTTGCVMACLLNENQISTPGDHLELSRSVRDWMASTYDHLRNIVDEGELQWENDVSTSGLSNLEAVDGAGAVTSPVRVTESESVRKCRSPGRGPPPHATQSLDTATQPTCLPRA